MEFLRQIEDNIRHNCRLKLYPDGTREFTVSDRAIFREVGWEVDKLHGLDDGFRWWDDFEATPIVEKSIYQMERAEAVEFERKSANLERAKRRARVNVSDIALSNDFSYFVTLTLDAEKVNRYDVKEVTSKLNNWLDNRVRRDGLRYVLVAERHKDGAIHFHGFFNDALEAVDSGTVSLVGGGKPRKPRSKAQRAQWLAEGGHVVFNLPAWSLGFTTAIELYGEKRAAVGYVCKYISKSQEKIGGRWYYSGGALERPSVELFDADFSQFETVEGAHKFVIGELGASVIRWVEKGGEEHV